MPFGDVRLIQWVIGNREMPRAPSDNKNTLSEVGFEPTPTDVDCDLNAAP